MFLFFRQSVSFVYKYETNLQTTPVTAILFELFNQKKLLFKTNIITYYLFYKPNKKTKKFKFHSCFLIKKVVSCLDFRPGFLYNTNCVEFRSERRLCCYAQFRDKYYGTCQS